MPLGHPSDSPTQSDTSGARARTSRRLDRRPVGLMAVAATAVVALFAGVFAFATASADEVVGGGAGGSTPPAPQSQDAALASSVDVGDPGVVNSVDFAELETTPIRQWGVVGTGSSYTSAKSQVWDFAEIGDVVYVGGIFTGVQRNADDPTSSVIAQPYLAAFDRDTGEWVSTFRPTFDRSVYALDVAPDGTLLVGGEFTKVNGVNRGGLVKLDPVTGATVASFPTYISAGNQPMVRDIVVDGSQVYIAGQISTVWAPNGAPWTWNAARLDAVTGRIDLNFSPRFMGGVWQLAVDKDRGRVHAAGFFTSVSGQSGTASFASVTEATGAYIPGLAPFVHNEPDGQRDTVAVVYGEGKIYVGGAQHIIQVLDAATNQRLGFVTSGMGCNTFGPTCGYTGGGDYQVLEMAADGMVLAGCHCYGANAIYNSLTNLRTPNKFAHGLSTVTDEVPSWTPALRQRSVGTYALFVDSNHCLYIGGDYVRRGDGGWMGGFGRFCEPNVAPAAIAATSSNRGVSVSWTAPEAPLPIAYYKVYRNGVFAGDATGTSFGFTNLAEDSQQTITVRSVDVAGRHSPEASVTVTVAGADTEAPTTPANASATVEGRSVTLRWDASTDLPDPGGVGVSGYLIHRDWAFVKFISAETLSFTDTDVSLGSRRYEIRAVDRGNHFSAPAVLTAFVGVVDDQPPTVPGAPSAAVGGPTGQTVTLTWTASTDLPNPGGVGVSGYLIHRDWAFVKFVSANTLSFTDDGVALGARRYEIRAVDLGNRYSAPATLNVVVGPVDDQPPTVPGGVTATASGNSVTLAWTASTDQPNPGGVGLSGYLIHRDWEFLKFVAAGTQTYTDTNVPAGNRRYEVRAVDLGNRYSTPSSPVNVTVGG